VLIVGALALLWQLIAAPRLALVKRETELAQKEAVITDLEKAYKIQHDGLVAAQKDVEKLAADAKARDKILIDAQQKKNELAKKLTTVQRSFYEYKRNAPVDMQKCLDLPIGDMHEQLLQRFGAAGNPDAMRRSVAAERDAAAADADQ
jgi:hypothetical protein